MSGGTEAGQRDDVAVLQRRCGPLGAAGRRLLADRRLAVHLGVQVGGMSTPELSDSTASTPVSVSRTISPGRLRCRGR